MNVVNLLFDRCIKGEPAIEEYYGLHLEAKTLGDEVGEAVMQLSVAQSHLNPGRVVLVKTESVSFVYERFPFLIAWIL